MAKRGIYPNALSTGRPVTQGTNGAVASPHYLASHAGLEMLKSGGHCVDAAIAMNAVLSVVFNHMAGLGGDLFCQVWDSRSKDISAINGSGRSGENVTMDLYKEKDMDSIPMRGPLSANTVPGAVDAWAKLHQKFGRLDWQELFQPAIMYAEEGFPVSAKYSDFLNKYEDTLRQFSITAQTLLNGQAPAKGAILKQPELAQSLRLVADQGADVFYRGELGSKIIEALQKAGGVLTETDFAEHESEWVTPITTDYRGITISELPPNTQGIATLMLLNILENYDLNDIGDDTADYYHLMTEATKLVFADRDKWVTDPNFLQAPIDDLLSKEYARQRKEMIDFEHAKKPGGLESGIDQGGTTYMCAVDSDGNACSLIQSPYHEFGSAFMAEGTGVLMQNRGAFFKLDPDSPNKVEPRKRVMHTIIPAMALKDGSPYMLFGTMGGEGQPQTQAAMLTRVVDFGYDMQQAIEAPRWLFGRTWGEQSQSLKLEGRITDGVVRDLERRGHEIQMAENWSQMMGHAQGIFVESQTGVLSAGADPRGDGLALSW